MNYKPCFCNSQGTFQKLFFVLSVLPCGLQWLFHVIPSYNLLFILLFLLFFYFSEYMPDVCLLFFLQTVVLWELEGLILKYFQIGSQSYKFKQRRKVRSVPVPGHTAKPLSYSSCFEKDGGERRSASLRSFSITSSPLPQGNEKQMTALLGAAHE